MYEYKFQADVYSFLVYSDANWASNKQHRKSTSGGVIMHGSHFIKSWSKTQTVVALSSAESELYALVKASAETLGMTSIFRDYGMNMKNVVLSDASAALGIVQRQGLGKIRHLDTSYLFVQDLNAEKKMRYEKVDGADNVADKLTKGLSRDLMIKHTSRINGVFMEGRADVNPKLMQG